MIVIDKILFDFSARDELFACNLYANWDEFCHHCVTEILHDFFSTSDEKNELIEIDLLELNLGTIPEEEFYTLFPLRLREELKHIFRPYIMRKFDSRGLAEKRMENLLFYLTCGFSKPEWSDENFDLSEELSFILEYAPGCITRLIQSCFGQKYCMERLLEGISGQLFARLISRWNGESGLTPEEKQRVLVQMATTSSDIALRFFEKIKEDEILFLQLFTRLDSGSGENQTLLESICAKIKMQLSHYVRESLRLGLLEIWKEDLFWLTSPTVSRFEKQRYLAMVLETQPEVVVRFIHETKVDHALTMLADILNTITVKQIMQTECERHAEVGIPSYWHYLYNWLLENYPFNGIFSFGDKKQFHRHLNVKFLSFIRKRAYSAYLSKAELTVQFLVEVFGREYYLEVLNVIYDRQAKNSDGLPIATGYFDMELYYVFMQLSLLDKSALSINTGSDIASGKHMIDILSCSCDSRVLTEWLTDKRMSGKEKQAILTLLSKEQPDGVLTWIKGLLGWKPELFVLLAKFTDMAFVRQLAVSHSFYAAELFRQLSACLYADSVRAKWFADVAPDRFSFLLRQSMLRWMGASDGMMVSLQESITDIIRCLCREVFGEGDGLVFPDRSVEEDVIEIMKVVAAHFSVKKGTDCSEQIVLADTGKAESEYISDVFCSRERVIRLQALLSNGEFSEGERQRAIALLLDAYKDDCEVFLSYLQAEHLLTSSIEIMDRTLFEQFIVQLFKKKTGQENSCLLSFCRWLLLHEPLFTPFFSGGSVALREKMLLLLAYGKTSLSVKGERITEIGMLFVMELFGTACAKRVFQLIFSELMREMSGDMFSNTMELFSFLLRITDYSVLNPERSTVLSVNEKQKHETAGQSENLSVGISPTPEYESLARFPIAVEDKSDLQATFEKSLNRPDDFIEWLHENSFSRENKRDIVQRYAMEHPCDFIGLLRQCLSRTGWFVSFVELWDTTTVLQWIGRISITGAEFFTRMIEMLQKETEIFSVIKGNELLQSCSISKALWLFLLKEDVFGKDVVRPEYIIRQFIIYLHDVCTGQCACEGDEFLSWRELMIRLANNLRVESDTTFFNTSSEEVCSSFLPHDEPLGYTSTLKEEASDILSDKDNSKTGYTEVFPDGWDNAILSNWLKDPAVSGMMKQRVLREYIVCQPKRLLFFVREWLSGQDFSLDEWNEWLDEKDWLRIITEISLSKAEVLRQVITYLRSNGAITAFSAQTGLIVFLLEKAPEFWSNENTIDTVNRFVHVLYWVEKEAKGKMFQPNMPFEETVTKILTDLVITETGKDTDAGEKQDDEPEYLFVDNAGLALLAPWFSRLFAILGLLNKEKKDFKDTASRIRAIFIIQRLVIFEDREYKERELAFNRILVNCPFYIPLPKRMELKQEELRIIEEMLEGVKANWSKMKNTSIEGFRHSFIERVGRIEQQEEKWLLTVDTRSYDILLDSLPWSYSRIRFPWLKKQVHVSWRSGEQMDY